MEDLWRDLRHGARLLARHPGFSGVAVASLALGIGLSTTMFSVVNAVLLRPLSLSEPTRLVEIYSSPNEEFRHLTSSYPDYLDLRESVDAFDDIAAHAYVAALFTREGRSESIRGEAVTTNFFDVLGVPISHGRAFLPEEGRTPDTHPVAVISHGLWQRRLGGDPHTLGSHIRLSGLDYTVVGVAPAEFAGTIPGMEPEFWVPVMMVEKLSVSGIQATMGPPIGNTRLERRGTRWLFLKGRLAPGRNLQEARAQATTVMARLAEAHPDSNEDLEATLLPALGVRIHPLVDGILTPAAALLLASVGLVLLIACANVANMLLARSSARRREIAIRLAIGAGRWRLLRQLLTESLLLASLGGAAGLLLAYWATQLLAVAPPPLPLELSFHYAIDTRVLIFALGASLLTSLLFGLVPALQASKPDVVPALKDEVGPREPRRRRISLRNALVVGQLAVSLMLLVSGTLLLRGLSRAAHIDPGFDPERLTSLSFNLKMHGYSLEQALAFQEQVLGRVRALPGVEAVALTTRTPFDADVNLEGVKLPGHHQPDSDGDTIDATNVGPGYFATVGLTLLEGRDFTAADREDTPAVVVINQTMADKYWPGRSPLGERIYTEEFDQPPHQVVGVVRDHKVRSLGEEPRPYLHFALGQKPTRRVTLLARTNAPGRALVSQLRGAILELDPEIAFSQEGPLSDRVGESLLPTRLGAGVLGAFACLALLLAAVGLYGVVAYSVSQRTRELGVRAALGASRRDQLRLVVGQGMSLAALGVGLGLLGALAATRVLSALLYGLSSLDPISFLWAATLLLAVTFLANLLPALRAARIDPMRALRSE